MSHTSRAARRQATAGRRRASGIYGAIVTAAILTAAGGLLDTGAMAVAVVITLLVYWVAEEYAELLGQQAEQGKPAGHLYVRAELAATWPMVSTSFGPLLVLVLARISGASDAAAANIGLGAAIAVLVYHVWSAGHAAHLRGLRLLIATGVAAALGIVMILLKNFILVHLH